MADDINTEAEFLLEDVDFSGGNAHIAYTINALGGSASQVSEDRAYLYKSEDAVLSKEQETILKDIVSKDIQKASIFDLSIEDALLKELKRKMNSFIPDVHVAVWIDRITHDYVYYTVDFDTTFYSGYSFDSEGVPTISDERVEVERRSIFLPVDDNSGHEDPNRLMKNFAHTPDVNDPLVWKFRIDSEDYIKASIYALKTNRVELSEEEKGSVVEKVAEAYKKFFPEDQELPSVLKSSSEIDTSGAASDGNIGSMDNTSTIKNVPSGINIEKKKDNMPDKNTDSTDNTTTTTNESVDNQDLETLQKSMVEVTELLKAADARAEAAEKKADDIEKYAKAEKLEKAQSDMTEIVKAWDLDESIEVVEVVKALMKSGSDVLVTVMEDLHKKVEEVKKNFGEEEHGVDGDIKNSTGTDKIKKSVGDILKARKAKSSF